MIAKPHDMPSPGPRRGARTPRFPDRLLAEAVRAYERDGNEPLDEPAAVQAAAAASGGDAERWIVERARSLSIAGPIHEALRKIHRTTVLVLVLIGVVAILAGAGAARAAFGGREVNVFWGLSGLLGVQTLLLLVWALLMWRGAAALSGASLGGLVLGLGGRLARPLHRGRVHAAAFAGAAGVLGSGSIGRFTISAISHGAWVVFNSACVLLIVLMLSAWHYRFVWETTILSAETYAGLTRALAWLPRTLGFPVPEATQIAASEWAARPAGGDDEATRLAWSGFMVGTLVSYALLPRLFLFMLCLGGALRARRRFRLDADRPGYVRLRARLVPSSARIGIVDPEGAMPGLDESAAAAAAPAGRPGGGAPAFLGLEIDPGGAPWPPVVNGVRAADLGLVDASGDRRRVLEALAAAPRAPRAVVVVCSLTTTPDRGHRAFLAQLVHAAGAPVGLVLTGGETMRRRGDGAVVEGRVDDWRRLAGEAGVGGNRVVEVDLEHLTEASRANLAGLVGTAPVGAAPAPTRQVERAFALIVDHLHSWPAEPGPAERAELHREIALLHRAEHASWRSFLRAPSLDRLRADPAAALRAGAERVAGLLPPRLRASPRWAAAGAAAGALGCVAAATLVAPAAIGALPVWSSLGAVVAAVAGALPGVSRAGREASASSSRDEAVRAAAMFALLLELQGRPEAQITRVLDRTAGGDEGPGIGEVRAARAWLEGLRHRLDLALAAEEGA